MIIIPLNVKKPGIFVATETGVKKPPKGLRQNG